MPALPRPAIRAARTVTLAAAYSCKGDGVAGAALDTFPSPLDALGPGPG
jgi:hypothetical protein